MGYDVEVISIEEASELRSKYKGLKSYSSKADIFGLCVEFLTEDWEHLKMWGDNFYSMSEDIRAHAKIYSINDPSREMRVLFEPLSSTAFLFNFDYYGWIKSIALGISGSILEEAHDAYSVHGAVLDIDGKGVTLIAPSKTGKTTQSWGLLRAENTRLVTDDWYFVKLGGGRPVIMGSEKNCYIDADIGDVWEEYKPLVQAVKFDNMGRGIANIRWVTGNSSVITMTTMKHIILMKRDKNDKEAIRRMDAAEAVDYMIEHDFCNPHQMVRDEYKMELRKQFFRDFFGNSNVYMVNTILSPQETQERIREVVR